MGLLTHEEGPKVADLLPKICYTYPTMQKLGKVIHYLKKDPKKYKSCDTPLISADRAIFHQKSVILTILRNADKNCILINFVHFFLTCFDSFLINFIV